MTEIVLFVSCMVPRDIFCLYCTMKKAHSAAARLERRVDRLLYSSRCIARRPLDVNHHSTQRGIRKQAGEGDHLGLNPSVPATCFPSSATVCNSWDEDLAQQVGEGLGKEAMAEGVNVLLGPGMNIKRNPLCGRNFEYFSEDPYLTGKMAAAEIRGIQSEGVSACCKHFAVNSQETRRMAMNSVLDERTLRDVQLQRGKWCIRERKPASSDGHPPERVGI